MALCLSLEELEQSVVHAIEKNAMLIYWHHATDQFTYLIASDQAIFNQELKLMRSYCRDGTITSITAGETINLNGTNLHTMEVELKDHPCYAYMMVRRQGNFGDADKTPYFFTSKVTRDKTIAYLVKVMPQNRIMPYLFLRINANRVNPYDIIHINEFETEDPYENSGSILSHFYRDESGLSRAGDPDIFIERESFLVWCQDGKRHTMELYCDENGKEKGLPPNHRVNAMIHAGRFTTKMFCDVDSKSRNQKLKDSWGPNYCVGDVLWKVPSGKPMPDTCVYGDNPILFIMEERTACAQMKIEHGEENSTSMMQATMKKKQLPQGISLSMAEIAHHEANPVWEHVGYHVQSTQASEDSGYKALLSSWHVE